MSNPGNVTPYGDLVHRAAQCGGPDELLKQVGQEHYAQGKHDGLMNVTWAIPAGIGLFEGGKWLVKRAIRWYRIDRHVRKKRIEAAEKQFKEQWNAMDLDERLKEVQSDQLETT